MNIPFLLGTFFTASIGAIVKRGLAAIGIGILTFGAITTAFNQIVSIAQSHFNNVASDVLQILNLAGTGEALGMVNRCFTLQTRF